MHPAQATALCNLMNATAAVWPTVAITHHHHGWRVQCWRTGEEEPAIEQTGPSLAKCLIDCLPEVNTHLAAVALGGTEGRS